MTIKIAEYELELNEKTKIIEKMEAEQKEEQEGFLKR
jgi:hypothetical protein